MQTAAVVNQQSSTAGHAQIEFVVDGVPRRLDCCDVSDVPFEAGSAVRSPDLWQHKANYSGYYWAATTGRHVWFESLYERSALMRLDRDRGVVAIAAQPMWIHWPAPDAAKHAPDYFVRSDGGGGVLVDVRPAERIDAATARVFDRTSEMCDRIGWRYRVVDDVGSHEQRNLRLFSGYRFQRWRSEDASSTLVACSGQTAPLSEWVRRLRGHALDPVGAVFSAVWWRELVVDMARPVTMATAAEAI